MALDEDQYSTGFSLPVDVQDRFLPDPPKRILALDGGGIRGAISLGILKHIENVLADEWERKTGHPKKDFRLWHYFDFIVGTSTGAIIATLLAAGLSVSTVKALYARFAAEVFQPRGYLSWWPEFLKIATGRSVFERSRLIKLLNEELPKIEGWKAEDYLLKDAPLRTGLGIVVRCIDTDHTWLVHNNKRAKYFDTNAAVPLTQWVRASTAAPPYYRPERIALTKPSGKEEHVIADGGLSAFNNPALGALIVSTLKGQVGKSNPPIYRGFQWELGHDKLIIVSVGTGWLKRRREQNKLSDSKPEISNLKRLLRPLQLWRWRPTILRLQEPMIQAFMGDANFLSQALLMWMSDTKTRSPVHGAAENFSNEFLHPDASSSKHFLKYLRYDVPLHEPTSYPRDYFGNGTLSEAEAETLGIEYFDFTKGSNVNALLAIGDHAGKTKVEKDHFPDEFNPHFWFRRREVRHPAEILRNQCGRTWMIVRRYVSRLVSRLKAVGPVIT